MTTAVQQAVQDALQLNGMGQLSAVGGVAGQLIANSLNISALRTNDVLNKEEWLQYDSAVVQVARQRMAVVAMLLGKGLRFSLANALGTTVLQHELGSDVDPAEINMSGVTEGTRDRQTFSLVNLPIPITHKDFQINIRNLESSRRNGTSLDVSMAMLAGKVVAESIENAVLNGVSITSGGGTVYGIFNAPNANTGSLVADWDLSATTGAQILADILEMITQAQSKNYYGPYQLIVPNDYKLKMNDDFKANSDRTILERILAIPEIEGVTASSFSPANKVALVQTTSDVIEVVDGMQPTTVMWDSHGGMLVNFKVMGIMVPRVRYDAKLQSGITVHAFP